MKLFKLMALLSSVMAVTAASAKPPTKQITGSVVDANGSAVADCTVLLVEMGADEPTIVSTTGTDGAGRFNLGALSADPSLFEVCVVDKSGLVSTRLLSGWSDNEIISVPHPAYVNLLVTNGESTALANAPIAISGEFPHEVVAFDWSVRKALYQYIVLTNADGQIIIRGNADSKLYAEPQDPRYQPATFGGSTDGRRFDDLLVFPSESQIVNRSMAVVPSSEITGQITDSKTGAPISGAKVVFIARESGLRVVNAITDADGRYLVEKPVPAEYLFAGASAQFGLTGQVRKYVPVEGEEKLLVSPGKRVIQDYKVRQLIVAAKPVRGQERIASRAPTPSPLKGKAGMGMNARLDLPKKTAAHIADRSIPAAHEKTVVAGVEAHRQKTSTRGNDPKIDDLVIPSQQFVPSPSVPGQPRISRPGEASAQSSAHNVTPPTVRPSASHPKVIQPVTPIPNEPKLAQLPMAPGNVSLITGEVVDSKGAPVPAELVALVERTPEGIRTVTTARTESSGIFELPSRHDSGVYELCTFDRSGVVSRIELPSDPKCIILPAPQPSFIRVNIVDPRGRPIANARFVVKQGDRETTALDRTGKQAADHLILNSDANGQILVTANSGSCESIMPVDERYQPNTVEEGNPQFDNLLMFPAPGQTVTRSIQLEPSATITGRVTDGTGGPVADANLIFIWGNFGAPVTVATTDSNGYYKVSQAIAHSYTMQGIFDKGLVAPRAGLRPQSFTLVKGQQTFDVTSGSHLVENYVVRKPAPQKK